MKAAYDQMVAGLTQFKHLFRQTAAQCGNVGLLPTAPARPIIDPTPAASAPTAPAQLTEAPAPSPGLPVAPPS